MRPDCWTVPDMTGNITIRPYLTLIFVHLLICLDTSLNGWFGDELITHTQNTQGSTGMLYKNHRISRTIRRTEILEGYLCAPLNHKTQEFYTVFSREKGVLWSRIYGKHVVQYRVFM
jgi:hypothetical protein